MVSRASVLPAPVIVSEPAGSTRPVAKVPLAKSRKNWPPTVVLDPMFCVSLNRALAARSTEVWEIWNRLSYFCPLSWSR